MFIDWILEGYYYLTALCARKNLTQYGIGSWALITGSTDGIGLGFAKVLAKQGFNIVLVSRNPEKLQNVEQELKLNPIQVLSIVKDFSKCPENPSDFFDDIDAQTKNLDISIVINNVGTAVYGYFHENTTQDVLNQIAVNIWPVVYLSKIFLRRMLNRNKPSGLINLSSTGAISPLSGLSVYTAGKSFDDLFTLDLNEEIRYLVKHEKLQQIDILSLQPGYVDTNLAKDFDSKPLVITPEQCAESALRVLGKANYSSCHWKHLLISINIKNMPKYLLSKITLKMMLEAKEKVNRKSLE